MSAANAKAPEPSMEEILASIRRIIADDQEVARPPEPAASSGPPPASERWAPSGPGEIEDEGILDLAEAPPRPVAAASQQVALEARVTDVAFREIAPGRIDYDAVEVGHMDLQLANAGDRDEEFAPPDPVVPPSPSPNAANEEPADARSHDNDHLLSRATESSVGRTFNLLAHTVLSKNARTLEDLVSDMLRPMLKEWLDDNLPTLVERLVRSEIERIARGGR